MRNAIPAVLLAAAVVLAGCNGLALGGDETPAPTVTPAAVPTDEPTPTPVPQLAPGLTGEGVTDVFALGEAHAAGLANTSFTMQDDFSVTYPNGTSYRRSAVGGEFDVSEQRYRVARSASGELFDGSSVTTGVWSNGTRIIRAQALDGNTSYEVPRGADREPLAPRELGIASTNREQIYGLFGSVETRVTDREQRNGTTLYRIEATNVTSPAAFESEWRNPRNLTLVARIDSQGIVHEYRLSYTAALNGESVRIRRHVHYTDLGNTTVERPPWYDEAIANVSTATTTAG